MKKCLTVFFIFCGIANLLSQEEAHLSLFETDSTWIKEIIKFPIGFAQEIQFEGFEDLRFPTGWSKKNSPAFWSYTWAWSLNNTENLAVKEIEKNIQFYFDGLLGIGEGSNSEGTIPRTNAIFLENEKIKDISYYKGKVNTFDTRYTNKPMTLYVQANQRYCEKENKTIIVFRFSPRSFEDTIWAHLNSVKLLDDPCTR